MCVAWDKYDHEVNYLNIVHTRKCVRSPLPLSARVLSLNSFDLPDDVFSEGEIKPARVHKKKPVNGKTKKRSATEVCGLLTSQWIKFERAVSQPEMFWQC
jgi:poly(A) polymerase Pap1